MPHNPCYYGNQGLYNFKPAQRFALQSFENTDQKLSGVRYSPPKGVTPALARLIWRGEYDARVFAAAIVTLAAKGWITANETPSGILLKPTKNGKHLLHREKTLLSRLFTGRRTLPITGRSSIDLKGAQTLHFEVLMEEEGAFYNSALYGNSPFHNLLMWLWPSEVRRLRKHIKGYRLYLETTMAQRLDPVFQPDGELNDLCEAMPYLVAFDIRNSWADNFVRRIADQLDGTEGTTHLYDLGDRSLSRTPRQKRYFKKRPNTNFDS